MIAPAAKNILIVEDDKEIADSMAKSLQGIGHQIVAVFTTGEEAMGHAQKPPAPDLVIMDINLGGSIDGIQAGKFLEEHLKLPVIYITGYADKASLLEQEGRVPIMKPFTPQELKTAIDVVFYIISVKDAERKRPNPYPQDIFRDEI